MKQNEIRKFFQIFLLKQKTHKPEKHQKKKTNGLKKQKKNNAG